MLNITLFSQIISKLDTSKFKKLIKAHQSDKHQKGFNNKEQCHAELVSASHYHRIINILLN